MLEEKKQKTKTVQTSSKINFTDHVFYSDDIVFVWYMPCNNLQFIESTFSNTFQGIFYFIKINGHSFVNFFCISERENEK